MLNIMVRKKLQIRTASDAFTTASVVGPTDADCAFARGQSFVATDEHDEHPETKRFRQAHDDVAIARPAHHVRHVISAVNVRA